MKYTVDYFIKKFKKIPAKKWTTARFVKDGKRCALGHCGIDNFTIRNQEANTLMLLFDSQLLTQVSTINDMQSDQYKQKTPKKRILAALEDIKKKVK